MSYQSPPPQQRGYTAPPAAPPAKKGGSGCVWWLLGGCVVLVAGCVVVAGGGFLAYRSGLVTQNNLLRLIGQAPATVEVDNFRDDRIQVAIVQLDVPQNSNSGPYPDEYDAQLEAFDIHTTLISTHGRYRVDFGTRTGAADLGTCTLHLGSGDAYQFVALPDKIVINNVNAPAKAGPDFIVATSSLCR